MQVTISTNMAGRGTDILLGGNPNYMGRLKLKELLLPKVVMTADEDIAFEKKGKANIKQAKSWAADPAVFPCQLSADVMAAGAAACDAAALGWGGKALTELDAEERLVFATEKVRNSPRPARFRGSAGLAGVSTRQATPSSLQGEFRAGGRVHTPSRVAPRVGRHQLPQGSSTLHSLTTSDTSAHVGMGNVTQSCHLLTNSRKQAGSGSLPASRCEFPHGVGKRASLVCVNTCVIGVCWMSPQGPTDDPVVLGLRAVFEAMVAEYSVVTR